MSTTIATGLCKRIIACLDIAGGRTVKGVNFQNLRDAGDPVELSLLYEKFGADEIMYLDITATTENRKTTLDLVAGVAGRLSIPLTVGGGVSSIDDVEALLTAGADKVSVNTAAVRRPELISEIATAFGSQCCVVAIDARARTQSDFTGDSASPYQVLIKGGREALDLDALLWGRECVDRGAGEIMLTSWDRDGSRAGFDIEMTRAFSSLPVPVIASGGAAGAACFVEVFRDAGADAALAASIFHYSICTVDEIKQALNREGVPVRLC